MASHEQIVNGSGEKYGDVHCRVEEKVIRAKKIDFPSRLRERQKRYALKLVFARQTQEIIFFREN